MHDPHIYGPSYAPRLKWQCARCKAGNDVAICAGPAPKEVFVCRRCKRPTALAFARVSP